MARITQWQVTFNGQAWSHTGDEVEPAALREWLAEHAGETVRTTYGKVMVVADADPDTTYHLFRHVFDPTFAGKFVAWQTEETPSTGREY